MQQGGGIGYDFSTLRPRGTQAKKRRHRRLRSGVVHGCVGCDVRHHPVHRRAARRHDGDLALRSSRHRSSSSSPSATAACVRHFNLSVQVTDAFMAAVRRDEWPLVFPGGRLPARGEPDAVDDWPGWTEPVPAVRVVQPHARARALGRICGRLMITPSPACCSSTVSMTQQSLVSRADQRDQSVRRDSACPRTVPAISARSI